MKLSNRIVNTLTLWLLTCQLLVAQEIDPNLPEEPEYVSREEAFEIEKETLRAVADLALLPPQLNTDPGPEYAVANLDYGMTIGIERSPQGRLFGAWIGGGDNPEGHMLVAKSDDDGKTWSDPILVIDSRGDHLPIQRTVIVGNLWTDPQGRLWLFFDQVMAHYDGRAGLWATVCDNPDAERLEWSRPRRISHGVLLNKPIVRKNDEWLAFTYLLERPGMHSFNLDLFPELDPIRGVNVLVSKDQGTTWQRRGIVRTGDRDWHEPMAVEKANGDLWMLIRTKQGLVETTSNDGGQTWSEPIPSRGIAHPNARFHLRKLTSGRWLLIKHGEQIDAHNGRTKLSAWLSDDEGESWQGGLILDERRGLSYPDGIQTPDGSIYVSYDWERSKRGHILFAKVTEEDILAGELVDPDSRLKQPLMIPGKLNPETPKR